MTNKRKLIEALNRTRDALRNGDVVCVFPEGKITRNGVMDEFKEGFSRMIPEEMDVPVIPVRLGMLSGSIFSYYYGKIKMRKPMELPHPASVTIGKPVSKNLNSFELRQIISELAAEPQVAARSVAAADPDVEDVQAFGDRLHLRVRDSGGPMERLPASLQTAGVTLIHLKLVSPTLEDVFMQMLEQ